MTLLRKAVNEQAFLKAGLLGFPGSGKTYTATHLAIGMSHRLGDKKPVAFFDTETGSDFLIPRFEIEGIELLRVKSQAFRDLVEVGKEAEASCSVLIVDSITHIWRELCDAYQKRVKRTRLEFKDWAIIKSEWQQWTNLYLNSKLHVIVCGRAGYEWDFEETDGGKKELHKVGTKMKVEGEFGFEPSLLIEMERVSKGPEAGAGWIHRAHVLKDRTDTINGQAFDFTKPRKTYKKGDWVGAFKPFEPVFNSLNLGGEHVGVDAERNSETLFDANGDNSAARRAKRAAIATEEIQGTLVALWPGQDAASKRVKQAVIETLFDTRSWTAVESKSVEALEDGLKILRAYEAAAAASAEHNANDLTSAVALLEMCKSRAREAEELAVL